MTTVKKNLNLIGYLIALFTLLMIKTVVATPATSQQQGPQQWHLKSEMILRGDFIKLQEGHVYLETQKGTLALELSQFTDADQAIILKTGHEQLAVIDTSASRKEQLYAGMMVSAEALFAAGYLMVTIIILILARKRWYFRPYNLKLMTGLFLVGMIVFAYFSQI